ncbi:uncharacterized protein LOC143464763 [Clavelina lepadiformis]|uniref:uncharacterized protein LOC143464763 n=1 Tax=Clavelina lepadiformis TaxID=159417 RepID=UPI0040420D17
MGNGHSKRPVHGHQDWYTSDVKRNSSSVSMQYAKRRVQRRNSKRRHLKQVKRDRESQRITKHQLHRLCFDLKRTPWYLGRRLGLSEIEVQKILTKYQTKEDMKFHILLMWRKRNGWKASVQNLIVYLEVAGYQYDEYKVIVESQDTGEVRVYEKPPEMSPTKTKQARGHYRYDDYDVTYEAAGKIVKPDEVSSTLKRAQFSTNAEEDIKSFAKRSWKRPKSKRLNDNINNNNSKNIIDKADDSGIVTTPPLSTKSEDTEGESKRDDEERNRNFSCSGRSDAPSNIYIRRCSDSTVNYAKTTSSRPDSEAELSEIFNKIHDSKPKTCNDPARTQFVDVRRDVIEYKARHKKDETSEWENDDYRDEILRMSGRNYHKVHNDSVASNYNFFKFASQGQSTVKFQGQISGLDVLPDNRIVVSDGDNKQIQIFDQLGNFIRIFTTGSELSPKGIFVTRQCDIVVCCGNEVRVFTPNGKLKLAFGNGTFRNNCCSVCCDGIGNYYVTDIVGHTVSVYDAKGNIRKRFGYQGTKISELNQPVALTINQRHEVVVSDSQNHTIKVYSLAGRPLHALGGKGTEEGRFWNPFGLCFDKHGYLYVADCGNNRISMFDEKYNFIRHVLTEQDGLRMPSIIRINSIGQLIVTEWKRQDIKVFSLETAV